MQLASFGLCFEWTSNNRVAKIMMTLLECDWAIRKNNIVCFHCQYYNSIIMMNNETKSLNFFLQCHTFMTMPQIRQFLASYRTVNKHIYRKNCYSEKTLGMS